MAEINYSRPFVYEYQRKILDSPKRYTVTEASTKVGKSASHLIWLFERPLILKLKAGQQVWWVAPVYGQAEVMFNRLKNQITDRGFLKFNETKLTATYPTGAVMSFKSAEKPDNLFGDDVYAAVFDEFTRARETAWHALRSTLTATRGQCKFIGNVKGKKNWGWRMAQKAKAGEPDFDYFKITAYDAAAEGLLSYDEIESAKRELPESVFKELYLAEASEDGSNPFGLQFIQQCTYPVTTNEPVCYGIDLAKSTDYTVIIGLDKNGNVCHYERFQRPWRETMQAINLLKNVPMKIDSTGVGDPIVEEIQTKRGNIEGFKFSQYSKQQIMEGLALGIQQRKVGFPDGEIKNELDNFEFEYTRTGVRYTAPAGLHDDCVCALALAWDKFKSVGTGTISWI
jgi:phage FluMu gp28-like protein